MRVTLSVDVGDKDVDGAHDDLYQWLRQDPDLRAFVRREYPAAPPDGAMGALGELISLLLAPGGPTAAVGAAVVVWLQGRRGSQTVTLTLPDGTQVVVSSEKVRGLTAEGTSELAERVAAALRQERDPRPVPRTHGAEGPEEAQDARGAERAREAEGDRGAERAREPEGSQGAGGIRMPGGAPQGTGRAGPSGEAG
ncbi:effector-associated constant component EACC1 [Streptomyces nitrosporeus]|uniref:effector-associated constant component EACC1 n=1 Tax=Streptomyces nitrosporeus TaxID=28894 RepID=UPI0033317740